MNLGLTGKTALVTGGARGIGAAIVRALEAEGVEVAITSRELRNVLPPYRVDILVNNIGHTLDVTDPHCDASVYAQVMDVNFYHAVRWSNTYIPDMKEKGWGRIVNITSVAGLENMGPVTYCAAKAALTAYTHSMGRVLASESPGIVMTAVYPSVIKTKGGHWAKATKEHTEKYLRERVPTKRFQTEEEFASVVVFYCSEQAKSCHGAIIAADQGQSRHFSPHVYLGA